MIKNNNITRRGFIGTTSVATTGLLLVPSNMIAGLPNALKVYIVIHSHADLSWPDTPEICTNLNCQAIEQSITILRDLPNFKFCEEDAFVLQEFLRQGKLIGLQMT